MLFWKKMTLPVFFCALCLFAFPVAGFSASDWPQKPVTIISNYGAGGIIDAAARIMAMALEKEMGAKFIVKNTTGSGGTIGSAEAANAAPDGYTLAVITGGPMVAQPTFRELPYKVDAWDLISLVSQSPCAIQVNKDSPYKTLEDFIKAAQEKPDQIVVASTGIAGSPHLAIVGFSKYFNVKLRHMSERSSAESLKSLAGGTIEAIFDTESYITRYDTRGLLRFASERSKDPALKDIPCVKESGFPIYLSIWTGLGAPKGTPPEILDKLHDALAKAVKDPKVQQLFEQAGMNPLYLPKPEFEKFYAEQTQLYKELLGEAGLLKK